MMNRILQELTQNKAVLEIEKGRNTLGNLSIHEEALLYATSYENKPRKLLIVKQNAYTAQQLWERMTPLLNDDVLLFHVEESLQVEAIAASPQIAARQVEVLQQLTTRDTCICITSVAGYTRFLASPTTFKKHNLHVQVGQQLELQDVKDALFRAGYSYTPRVDRPLTYAARGGIIDVFPIQEEYPIRIEFFDTEVESIRKFDVVTQRTIETISEVTLSTASTLLWDEEEIKEIVEGANAQLQIDKKKRSDVEQGQLQGQIDADIDLLVNYAKEPYLYRYTSFLKKQYTLEDYGFTQTILSSIEDIRNNYRYMQEEAISYLQELMQENKWMMRFGVYANLQDLERNKHVMMTHVFEQDSSVQSGMLTLMSGDIGMERTLDEIITNSLEHRVVVSLQEKQLPEVLSYFDDRNIPYKQDAKQFDVGISICDIPLYEGITCLDENLYIYTAKEIYQTVSFVARYTNKFNEAEVLYDYNELEIGDFVVHNQYGIGMYLGIETKEVQGINKDFLKVAYKGDDILFVPLEQFKLIRKFVSKEGARPKLHKLGSDQWKKTKEKVGTSVANIAERLVNLYAMRDTKIGYAFSKDNEMQFNFEQDFPYTLTNDQAQAVEEIKRDMEMPKPMDRLLCGDVGFGKTEVAVRAAFKAVIDHKQVAFLCPTTILSNQHYHTFIKRFENYPVRIEVLNRFVVPKRQKEILKDVAEGKVDILIGTHRILSKDVTFKDLGFLVIDEEQRFGVEHKEKIKEFKNSVDVLSLSATPIPRTLQMSLIGVRSLSQLNTPPKNRMPVQTYVIERNMAFVKEVIQRELVRGGQVFYIYNNVKDIYMHAKKLQKEFEDIKVGVAHGQMSREEIEQVMEGFVENTYQVLMCTTIVETGIDIPNANTIIIDHADMFGLSQLYQIKGRVGRSNRLAYAYLMYSPQKQLSEIAQKRLQSIKEFTQLGSGYKIAMRDLTIRGAGDMLGPQQAGFIDTVGIDLYIEMLHDAIKKEQGIEIEEKSSIPISPIAVDAYVPKDFIPEDYETLTLYQTMEKIQTISELYTYYESFKDNYGKPPKAIDMLFEKKRVDILLSKDYIEKVKDRKEKLELTFTSQWSDSVDGVSLFEEMTKISQDIALHYKQMKIILQIPKHKEWLNDFVRVLEYVQDISEEKK